MISSEDKAYIVENGSVIIERMPTLRGGCLYLSAMLVAMVNDNSNLEAKLVTGSLVVKDKTIFSHSPITGLLSSGNDSLASWDGHAWVSFAGAVFDFSVFQTIKSEITPIEIRELFHNVFGRIDHIAEDKNRLDEIGVVYSQHEELTDLHVTALIKSADHMGLING